MKIVFVIDSWNKGNGCIVVTHTLAKELRDRGHEVSLVTTAGEEASNFNGKVYTVPGFYMPGVKEAMKNMKFLFGVGKKKVYRSAFEGAHVVEVLFPYFMAKNAVKVAKEMNIPVMGACHIQSQNMTGAMGKDNKSMDKFFNSWFNYELFNRVDAIHCPSEFAADLIQAKGSRAHFRVISNGIPREFVPLEKPKRPDFFGDYFVLMNVGRHAMEKNQETLIDALLKSKYKDKIKLLLCGKGETSERLKERGRELPVEPLVRFISEEEKLLFLNTADLYIHSSGIELESRSCLEAIGCGLPCLIEDSPNSAASQFALDDRFLFNSGNIEEMTARIDYWYEKRAELKKLKKPTLKSAEQYRIDKTMDAKEQLYKDVIKSHFHPNGLLPKGEKIGPLIMKKVS